MKSTMNDCTTRMMSIGTPSAACMRKPPALNAPNSRPAKSVPHGVEPPSSATVMASKPMPASMPVVKPVVTAPVHLLGAREAHEAAREEHRQQA